jgi:hypothetical protein
VKIDLTTGALTIVGNFGLGYPLRMIALACNKEGEMYAVASNGNFYTVNKTTGTATFIASTGASPSEKLQSLTFDHNTGRLFWVMRKNDNYGSLPRECRLIEIEPTSGAAFDYGVLGGNAELVGLFSLPVIIVPTYEITASVNGGNGIIDPEGTVPVLHGENQTFTFTPNTNYKISQVLVDGENDAEAIEAGSYTFENVTTDHTIEVYFEFLEGINTNNDTPIQIFSHNNVVTIFNKDRIQVKQVEILDMYGRVVWKGHAINDKTEILLTVASGVYAVHIIANDNQHFVAKITIQ